MQLARLHVLGAAALPARLCEVHLAIGEGNPALGLELFERLGHLVEGPIGQAHDVPEVAAREGSAQHTPHVADSRGQLDGPAHPLGYFLHSETPAYTIKTD